MSRGFSKTEVYEMSVRQFMFLAKVSNRLEQLEQLQTIYTLVSAGGRHLEEHSFSAMVNGLKYGKG